MAYTLQEMKRQYPNSLSGLNDVDAIYKIAEMTGEDPQELAEEYGVIAANQGDFSRGISSSVDSMQAGLYGLASWAAGSSPKEGSVLSKVRDWGYEGFKRNMGEVQLRSKPTDNIENAETFGDYVDATQYWAGYAIPQIAEALIGSKGAGFVTRKSLERGVEKEITKKYGKDLNPGARAAIMNSKKVQEQLDKIPGAVRKGEYAGIYGQAVGTELGHTYGGAIDEALSEGKTIDDVDYGRATKFGLAAGAAEGLTDAFTLGLARLAPKGSKMQNLLGKDGALTSKSRTINATSRGLIGGSAEAGTEVLQTGLEEMGAGKTFEEADFSDPTSAFAGFVGGGMMGTVGGATVKKRDPQEVLDEAAETTAAETEAEKERQNSRNQEQQETARLNAEEAELERIEELRDIHSQTFPSVKAWNAEQKQELDIALKAQLQNPNSELSLEFKAWRKENQVYLSNDDAENKKIVDKFLKDRQGTESAQDVRNAHTQALDAHAALQEEKQNRPPEVQATIDSSISGWLERRRVAVLQNNTQELLAIEEEVADLDSQIPLVTAEWQENKRLFDSFDEALEETTDTADTTEAAAVDEDTTGTTEAAAVDEDTTVEEDTAAEETPFELTPPEVPTQKEFDAAKKAEELAEELAEEDSTEINKDQGQLFSVNPFRKTKKVKGKDTITKSWQRFEDAAEEFGQDFETQYETLRTAIFKGASDKTYQNKLDEARQLKEDREIVGGIFGKEMRVMGQVGLEGDWQAKTIELLLDAANRGNLEEYLYYQNGKWKFAMTDIAKAITGKKKDFSENDRKAVEKALNAYRRKQTKYGEMSETRETVGEFLDRTLRKMQTVVKQTPQDESIEATEQALDEVKKDPAVSGINIVDRPSDTKVSSKPEFTPRSDSEIKAGVKEPVISPQKAINNKLKSLKARVPVLKRAATNAEKKKLPDAKKKRERANKAEEELQGLVRFQAKSKFEKQREDLVTKQNKARNLLKKAKTNLSKARQRGAKKSILKKLETEVNTRQNAFDVATKAKEVLQSPEAKEQLKVQRRQNLEDKKEGLLPKGEPTPEFLSQQKKGDEKAVKLAKQILSSKGAKDDVAGEWDAIKSNDIKSFDELDTTYQYEWVSTITTAINEDNYGNLETLQRAIERSIRNEKSDSVAETKDKEVDTGSSAESTTKKGSGTTTDTSRKKDTKPSKKLTKKSVEQIASEILGRNWRQTDSIIVTHLNNKDYDKAVSYIQKNQTREVEKKSQDPTLQQVAEMLRKPKKEDRATRKSIENMFRNLVGQKVYNRVAPRVTVFDTVAEAEKALNKDMKDTRGSVLVQVGVGSDVDINQMDGVSNYRERGKSRENDKMYFVLENITKGDELAVFMHEIGSHIGLDNILSPSEQTALVAKIRSWANERMNPNKYIEQEAAKRAIDKVAFLKNEGRLTKDFAVNPQSQIATRDSTNEAQETIAYFITEVINLSQDNTTTFFTDSKIQLPQNKSIFKQGSFLAKILNKFRNAFKELIGYQKGETDNLTAQNIIDMAFGAARIELETGGYERFNREEQLSGLDVGVKSRFGHYRSTMAFMERQRDQVSPEDVKDFYEVNIGSGLGQTSLSAPLNKANDKLKFSVNDYWQKKIDDYIAKKLPKNSKRKYIVPNGEFLEASKWSEFQREQGRREKAMRAGLKSIVEQRQREAQKHADSINDSDTIQTVTKNELSVPEKKESKQEVERFRNWLRKNTNSTVVQMFDNISSVFTFSSNATKFVHQLINEVAKKMPAAKRWYDNVLLAEKTRNRIKQHVEEIVVLARDLPKAKLTQVNKFIEKSTVEQVWGYNPYNESDERHSKVKVDPFMQKSFAKLDDKQKEIVTEVFAHGEAMRVRKQAISKVLGVDVAFFGAAGLTGPYAPLRRFGNYIAEFKSQELLDAEAAYKEKDSPNNLRKLERIKALEKNYRITFHGTPGAARKDVDENGDKYASAKSMPKSKNVVESRSPEYKVLQKVLVNLNATGLDPTSVEYKAIEKMVSEMYFDSLDEDNARRSQMKRKGFAGYDGDMLKSFQVNATAEANLIANMEHGKSIYTELAAAKIASKNDAKLERVYNMMVSHHTADLDNKQGVLTAIQDRLAAVNTVYMLTSSIGYHVTNATQVMMVTIPKLVGDFGLGNYSKAIGLYVKGLGIASDIVEFNFKKFKFQTKIDLNKLTKEQMKYKPLLEELQLRQLLDVGIEQDLAEYGKTDTGFDLIDKGNKAASTFSHRLYQVARLVEAYNRVSTATAAFEMAEANKGAVKRMGYGADGSVQYAISMVEDTQGNFSSIDAPLVLKKAPKLMGQYRKYQIMMAWAYTNAAKKSFSGASAQEKAAGRRTLGMLLGHAGLFSGAAGIPFSHLIAPLFMGIGEGEEPEDLERWIQENVQDKTLASMISRGLPSVFGIDMSTKLSQAKIFSPTPYTDFEMSEDALKAAFFELVAGPSAATASNVIRSYNYAKEGNAWRSIEYALPKGIRTAMESYRLSTEGYSLRNGDIVASPDDFSGWQLAINALGIPATDLNQLKWRRGEQYELNKYFSEQQSKIRKEYVKAKKDGDIAAAREAMADWKALQKAKDRVRPFFNDSRGALRKTPISSLLKAPTRQQEREEEYRQQLRY